MPDRHDDDRPLDLHASHALDTASLASDRAFDAIAARVLAEEGPAAKLNAALARGLSEVEGVGRYALIKRR